VWWSSRAVPNSTIGGQINTNFLVEFLKSWQTNKYNFSNSLTVKNHTIMTSTGQNSSPATHATAPTTKRKAGQPALAKVMCVNCKKRETPHASKKCGTCCSNDPRYKRRKIVHRKKQQQARRCLQAFSRQAVQESAPVTARARPLNLSIMAATSTVSSQPSGTCSQAGRPSVAKIICRFFAQLRAFNLMSAAQCGAVVRCVTSAYPGKSNDGVVPQDISHETVCQRRNCL